MFVKPLFFILTYFYLSGARNRTIMVCKLVIFEREMEAFLFGSPVIKKATYSAKTLYSFIDSALEYLSL